MSTVFPLLPTEEGSFTTISSSEVTAAVTLEPEVLRGPNTPVRPDNTVEAETEDGSDLTVIQTRPLDTNPSPPLQPTTSSTPQTPRLPNLAQAALKRLAHTSNAATDSPDDFQPLKKRKIQDVQEEDEDGEVCVCVVLTVPHVGCPLYQLLVRHIYKSSVAILPAHTCLLNRDISLLFIVTY